MKEIATISIGIGNIGIGNTSILATFNKDLGRKCFAFTKLDAGAIRGIKKSAFVATNGSENMV
ncbi:MAG: hypothetical protein IJI54_11600 [Kiritimatiellae bacterium]|nr:hypothetical protein [Kiritimatiellia bacterium]